MQPQIMQVAIGDSPDFPALVDPDEIWNGWYCPRFDRPTAERVVVWLNTQRDAAPPHHRAEYGQAHWDGDTLVITDGDTDPPEHVDPDDDGRYAIGAHSWCWERAAH